MTSADPRLGRAVDGDDNLLLAKLALTLLPADAVPVEADCKAKGSDKVGNGNGAGSRLLWAELTAFCWDSLGDAGWRLELTGANGARDWRPDDFRGLTGSSGEELRWLGGSVDRAAAAKLKEGRKTGGLNELSRCDLPDPVLLLEELAAEADAEPKDRAEDEKLELSVTMRSEERLRLKAGLSADSASASASSSSNAKT